MREGRTGDTPTAADTGLGILLVELTCLSGVGLVFKVDDGGGGGGVCGGGGGGVTSVNTGAAGFTGGCEAKMAAALGLAGWWWWCFEDT